MTTPPLTVLAVLFTTAQSRHEYSLAIGLSKFSNVLLLAVMRCAS
jgi:hypothetical protein